MRLGRGVLGVLGGFMKVPVRTDVARCEGLLLRLWEL